MIKGELTIDCIGSGFETKITEPDEVNDCIILWPLMIAISKSEPKLREPAIELISFFFGIPEKIVNDVVTVPCLDICCFEGMFYSILEKLRKLKKQ